MSSNVLRLGKTLPLIASRVSPGLEAQYLQKSATSGKSYHKQQNRALINFIYSHLYIFN